MSDTEQDSGEQDDGQVSEEGSAQVSNEKQELKGGRQEGIDWISILEEGNWPQFLVLL